MSALIYGSEILRAERRFRLFGNKTPRRILESKRPEVTNYIKRSFIICTACSSVTLLELLN
jgi:hypothetical protein